MALITTDSGICLSATGSTVYPSCATAIVREGEDQYIRTESERNIETDGICSGPPIVSFSCNISERVVVDSGKFITISNTCTLPITITGFVNSDPSRFSIFEYPKHVGESVYTSGNTSQLPIRLNPYQTFDIKTFFHPLRSELETGTPGTFDVRDGDKFGAKVSIYPGFPVLNCTDSETECDAFFTLTGEFICDDMDIPEFLNDQSRYTPPDLKTLEAIDNSYCIGRIPGTDNGLYTHDESQLTYSADSIENTFSGLSGASRVVAVQLENFLQTPSDQGDKEGWVDGNLWATGALGGFYASVTGLIDDGLDTSLNNLINYSLENHAVDYIFNATPKKMLVSYGGPNYATVSTDEPKTMTGMLFHVSGGENAEDARNGTVFFDRVIDVHGTRTRMFLAESGDFSAETLCNWTN